MYNEELDTSQLKYAVYLRRSREDKEHQIKSVPDQLEACESFAEYKGLNIVAVLKESKSAKKPGQREKFDLMLRDIRKGKYDAILAWHPDRLARNMKEAGEIIDMIDEGLIKDLKFVTHHFTNDASGKMLLGIAFVMSKQYSDKLSQDVSRGVKNRLKEGRTPIPKHGYVNDEGIYKPDGDNHLLIQRAWEMKKEGESHERIAEEINSLGFKRSFKTSNRVSTMSPQKLSNMFNDPFYYGILIQAEQKVDLRDIYDFAPAVSEEDYFEIQQQSLQSRNKPYAKKKRKAFYPLKGIVKCGFCNGNMYIAPSTSGDGVTKLLYCRCDNKSCQRHLPIPKSKRGLKKSIRMKYVFNFVYELLEEGLKLTEKEYNDYYGSLKTISKKRKQEIRSKLNNRRGLLKKLKIDLKELGLSILKQTTSNTVRGLGEEKIAELSAQKLSIEKEIKKLEEVLAKSEEEVMSLEQFLNISKNAYTVVKEGGPEIKDTICRFIFLNIDVGIDEILSYQLKEPFHTLLKQREILSGRGDRTRTCDLTAPSRTRYQLRHTPMSQNILTFLYNFIRLVHNLEEGGDK